MNTFSLNQFMLYTEDFFFRDGSIVIFHPIDVKSDSPGFLRSRKSLKEHIEYINNNDIKKAVVIAEDIGFLKQCLGLEELEIYPAVNANKFDYSPLYELPNIKKLQCETMYGLEQEKVASIDYGRFANLNETRVINSKGHENIQKAKKITDLSCYEFPVSRTLDGVIPNSNLINLEIGLSRLQTLEGIEMASKLQKLTLSYNRCLTDISSLSSLKKSLVYLDIEKCGKIQDFSVLKCLENLEVLRMRGAKKSSTPQVQQKMTELICMIIMH